MGDLLLRRVLWLDSLKFHLAGIILVVVEYVVESYTSLLFEVLSSVEFGNLLQKPVVDITAFQKLGDEVLVNDVTHELLTADDQAVTKFQVLDHHSGPVEHLATAQTWDVLVNLVILEEVSTRCRVVTCGSTSQLNVTL